MHLSFIVIFPYLMLLQCRRASSILSSSTVETQYLTFDMAHYGPNGGNFSSPNFPNNYPQDTILFYQFVASSNYRVQIEFEFFQIRGISPQCTHDYLDVFLNVTDLNLVQNLINDQLLHRFCGRNKPPLLVSGTNLLLLGFFTEDTQTERGFNGSFRFISSQPYEKNLVRQPCDYIFNSSISKRGKFFSSTYPGTYLPWQFCNYSFVGLPNERIHIRFRDLMLFKTPNTHHCAVDLIKLYDNTLNPPELQRFLSTFNQTKFLDHQNFTKEQSEQHHIADLCGTYPIPLDVYSTSNQLLFFFITTHYAELTDEEKTRHSDPSTSVWRKGFFAEYQFLSSLTKLDFVTTGKSNQYLSGTECDQTIKSFGQGHGRIQSPNWPHFYKPQTQCTTYFLGLDDRYTLENVEIEFEQFDVDCQIASFVIYNASRLYEHRLRKRPSSESNSSIALVSKNALAFSSYYQQELDFRENLSFCGHFKPEGRFVSRGALLKLAFLSNDRLSEHVLPSLNLGGKFQARYQFVKNHRQISADEYDELNPIACNFSYYQSRTQAGKFEPPRSSTNDYFANSNCTFNFNLFDYTSRLLIWYDYFNIVDDDYKLCLSDNLTYTYRSYVSLSFTRYPYVYCGYRNFPPPLLTSRSTEQLRIHFRANNDLESGLGFDGRYQFLNQSNLFFSSTCRSPFDEIICINETDQPSGNLSSNGYPENVICEWSYQTTTGFQFNLELTILDMDGSNTRDPPQGCQFSVLRIASEGRTEEFCGQQTEPTYILTDSNWFTIQFISLVRQSKDPLRGFSLSWTVVQIKTTDQCSSSEEYFDCTKVSNTTPGKPFCIHRSLVCDGSVQCRPLSTVDELPANCSPTDPSSSSWLSMSFLRRHYIIILIVFILSVVMLCIGILLIFLIVRTRRRTQREYLPTERKNIKKNSSSKIFLSNDNDQDSSDTDMLKQAVTTV